MDTRGSICLHRYGTELRPTVSLTDRNHAFLVSIFEEIGFGSLIYNTRLHNWSLVWQSQGDIMYVLSRTVTDMKNDKQKEKCRLMMEYVAIRKNQLSKHEHDPREDEILVALQII